MNIIEIDRINEDSMSPFTAIKFLARKIVTKCIIVLLIIILVTVVPVFIVVTSPIYLFRWILPFLARNFRKDLGKMATTSSTVFMADDIYGTPCANVLGYLAFSGIFDMEQFERELDKKVIQLRNENGTLVYPELQQNIVRWFGYSFWKWNPNFTLKNHIQVLNTMNEFHDSDMQELFAKGLELSFSKDKSPWEFTIIPNYISKIDKSECKSDTRKISTALIFRMHHSLGDGYSALKLFNKIFPAMNLENVIGNQKKMKRTSWLMGILRRIGMVLRAPIDLAEHFVESFDWLDNNPWHQLSLKNKYNVVISDPISIQLIKDIKNSHKISFASVVHSAIAGGIRNAMIKNGLEVPRKIHLSAPFPRSSHPDKLRNHL